MARTVRFTFYCDPEERQIIKQLANTMQRSQSDAVRLVLREALKGQSDSVSVTKSNEHGNHTAQRK